MRLAPQRRWLKRGAWTAVLAGLAVSGLVSAQPALEGPPPDEPAPGPEIVAEEAPPAVATSPSPLVVPPITEKEVAPAPPKADAPPIPEIPIRRTRHDRAILQAIDKITAETLRFEAAVGRPVRYKNMVFTVRACERSAPDELVQDAVAYVTIESQARPAPGRSAPPPRQAFRGWMYASSPGLNPVEHPVYDAWLISCRSSAPPIPAPAPAAAAVPTAAAPAAKAPPAKAPAPKVEPAAPPAKAPEPKAAPATPAPSEEAPAAATPPPSR